MSYDSRISVVARALRSRRDLPPPPAELRSRALGAIEVIAPNSQPSRLAATIAAAGGAGLTIALIGTACLVGVRHLRHPAPVHAGRPVDPRAAPLVAQIRAAVDSAKTWHMQGSDPYPTSPEKPWEIWGSTQPFFYREQWGDELLIDDGVTITHRLPLTPGSPFSRVTIERSHPASKSFGPSAAGSLMLPSSIIDSAARSSQLSNCVVSAEPPASTPRAAGASTTASELALIDRDVSLPHGRSGAQFTLTTIAKIVVDGSSYLPKSYSNSWSVTTSGTAALNTLSSATAEYNLPIPAAIKHFDLRATDRVTDLRAFPTSATALTTDSGQITIGPAALDKQGDIRIDVRVVGPALRADPTILGNHVVVNPGNLAYATDDQGRHYIPVPMPANDAPGTARIWLTPEVPLSRNASMPGQLCLHVAVAIPGVNMYIRKEKTVPPIEHTLTVNVPQSSPVPDLESDLLQPNGTRAPRFLPESVAIAQAKHIAGGGWSVLLQRAHDLVTKPAHTSTGFPIFAAVVPVSQNASDAPHFDREAAAHWWDIAANQARKIDDSAGEHNARYQAQLCRQVVRNR